MFENILITKSKKMVINLDNPLADYLTKKYILNSVRQNTSPLSKINTYISLFSVDKKIKLLLETFSCNSSKCFIKIDDIRVTQYANNWRALIKVTLNLEYNPQH